MVASCGRGECRCDIGIGVRAGVAWKAGIAKLLGRGARCACSDGASRLTFGGSLTRNVRLADWKCELLRKSRAKRSFWRLDE